MIRSVPNIISSVVDLIRQNESYENDAPYFDFGYHTYIANTLNEKSKSTAYRNKVFPFIGLILDIPQGMYPNPITETDCSLNIVIAYPTNRDMSPSDQETNIFIPILIPLYEHLLKWMWRSNYFNLQNDRIQHERMDQYYYGAEEGRNKWNALVSAIELNFRDLRIRNRNECEN